ncbi:Uncharacterized protein PECH_001108 [Penicillium ucsense]|uniref:Uncharacterized protein n=1 Tax=Penicillium ucsense TaxID=2839758 RepID=A0A8J8W7I3_9EURO|nr:Uncharacterized protein PECM_002336 [Penicillium ucsense]KAF7738340.1 Uncharacterized protein PECH_001108 [Penicillium ucsense]
MNQLPLRSHRAAQLQRTSICQLCEFSSTQARRSFSVGRGAAAAAAASTPRILTIRRPLAARSSRLSLAQPLACQTGTLRYRSRQASSKNAHLESENQAVEGLETEHVANANGHSNTTPANSHLSLREITSMIEGCTQKASELLARSEVPGNAEVEELLLKYEETARAIAPYWDVRDENAPSGEGNGNAVSSLLEMQEHEGSVTHIRDVEEILRTLADQVSTSMTQIIKNEKVFISPKALEHYVRAQCTLNRAEYLPEVFHLYANKPIPEEKSNPPKLLQANPKDVNSAVSADLANQAIDVAIKQKNLPLVLAMIDNTFCAPAFHRAKVFRRAAVPLVGLAAAPAACFTLASWASTLQNTMDPSTATGIAFAASLAYVAGTSSIGILAITTANDQMKRVTWLPGIPLRHRWLREEERAALDKVACAWGFRDPYMHGEETGEEWESLREFIGMRGMILDKTELMEGMQ